MPVHGARDLGVRDEFNRICTSSVLRNADIVIVWMASGRTIDHILEDATISDGIVNVWLLLCGEVDTFGIASTLDVEDASV